MLLINSLSLDFPWQAWLALACLSAGSGEMDARVGNQQRMKSKAGNHLRVLLSVRISAMEDLCQYPNFIVTGALWED